MDAKTRELLCRMLNVQKLPAHVEKFHDEVKAMHDRGFGRSGLHFAEIVMIAAMAPKPGPPPPKRGRPPKVRHG